MFVLVYSLLRASSMEKFIVNSKRGTQSVCCESCIHPAGTCTELVSYQGMLYVEYDLSRIFSCYVI